MLAVGLTILKWLGIILLAVLGVLVLFLLAVLLVPVRYHGKGAYEGGGSGTVTVSWLLHAVHVRFWYDGALDGRVRVLGIPVFRLRKQDKKRPKRDLGEEKQDQGAGAEKRRLDVGEEQRQPDAGVEQRQPDSGEEQRQPDTEKERQQTEPAAEPGQTKTEEVHPEDWERDIEEALRRDRQKERRTDRRILEKGKAFKENAERLYRWLTDSQNQETIRLAARQIRRLLKHVLPRKIGGNIRFGLDDPYRTGQVLAVLSLFYGVYGRDLCLTPVFEGQTLDGQLWMRGKIRIGTILVLGIQAYRNPQIRRLLKQWL